MALKNKSINWDKLPEVMTLDQLYQISHISKSTARFLLRSGKIPCLYSGKKTRCYKILKADVKTYLADREQFPEYYKATRGWYSKYSSPDLTNPPVPVIREDMHEYYAYLLQKYPDVLDTLLISRITGYGKTSINNWCNKNKLQHFLNKGRNMIPKVYLIDYFCSVHFRTIARKSEWHRKVLIEYSSWKYATR